MARNASAVPVNPTLSGNGLTWVLVASKDTFTTETHIFRAMGASPSTGAITISYGAETETQCAWSVVEFDGVDTSGTNGSGAIVQSGTASATDSPISVTLAAFGSTDNAAFSCAVHFSNENTTEGSGFTELSDSAVAENARGFQAQWKLNDNVPSCSWATTTADAQMVAVEIKAAAGAEAATPSLNLLGVGT
jgi:hypothetical protein